MATSPQATPPARKRGGLIALIVLGTIFVGVGWYLLASRDEQWDGQMTVTETWTDSSSQALESMFRGSRRSSSEVHRITVTFKRAGGLITGGMRVLDQSFLRNIAELLISKGSWQDNKITFEAIAQHPITGGLVSCEFDGTLVGDRLEGAFTYEVSPKQLTVDSPIFHGKGSFQLKR